MTTPAKKKSSTTILLIGLVASAGVLGFAYMQDESYEDYGLTSSVAVKQDQGNVTREVLSDGSVKKTINVPAPERAKSIKTIQEVVNDYIDSSPNKNEAIASLKAAYNIPQAENQKNIAQLKAQRAEYEFKAAEWKAKTNQLNEFGVSSLQSVEEPKPSNQLSQMGYFKRNGAESKDSSKNEKKGKVNLDDFELLSIIDNKKAKLLRGETEYSVKSGYTLHGSIKVTVSSDKVVLTNEKRKVNLYLD